MGKKYPPDYQDRLERHAKEMEYMMYEPRIGEPYYDTPDDLWQALSAKRRKERMKASRPYVLNAL